MGGVGECGDGRDWGVWGRGSGTTDGGGVTRPQEVCNGLVPSWANVHLLPAGRVYKCCLLISTPVVLS